jgi:hypothetical protein
MANDVGVEITRGPKGLDRIKQQLSDTGYKGERVVVLAASTIPVIFAEAQVATDVLQRIGMNIDLQTMERGRVVVRRTSREPVDKGGWNIFYTYLGGMGNISPGHIRDPGERCRCLVRLAQRPENGSIPGGLVRCAGPRYAAEDLPRDAGGILAEPHLCAARHV